MAAKQLYQLVSKTQLHKGAYVEVKGPWDTYGTVLSCERRQDGAFLNLIRGCEKRVGEKVVARF